MRRAVNTLYQLTSKGLKAAPEPMKAMHLYQGACDEVPDQVYDAVFETLNAIPGLYRECSARESLATLVAPRMAKEGWRFCPCFPARRTSEHTRIFELVHTNMANRLAHRALLEQQSAA